MTDATSTSPDLRATLLALHEHARWFATAAALMQLDPEAEPAAVGERLGRALLTAMRAIVDSEGWPDVERAGPDGARAAAELLLLATPDLDFLYRCLDLMTRAADDGRLDRADVELVRDHLLLLERGVQRHRRFAAVTPDELRMRPTADDA